MRSKKVIILTGEPVIACIAEMALADDGLVEMLEYVADRRPECLPEELQGHRGFDDVDVEKLWPHNYIEVVGGEERRLTDNEMLAELAARGCYYSFGEKAGRKDNASFLANTQAGEVKHASIMYHAKMTFFIGGISHRMARDLIRNYVGSDRDHEGSPSHESTRYCEMAPMFVCPEAIRGGGVFEESERGRFADAMQDAYDQYLFYIDRHVEKYKAMNGGREPQGMDRKRIYEAAGMILPLAGVTSLIWTTNPVAMEKLFRERCHEAADAEFRRFATKWRTLSLERWPNLFPNLRRDLAPNT